MIWLKNLLLLSIVILVHLPYGAFAADSRLNLTADEKEWLMLHPEIRVAPDPDFAPFEWFSIDGTYKGMAADYLRLVEQRLGIKFVLVQNKDWSQVMDMARSRQVDVLPAVARSPQREQYLLFTTPHITAKGVIVTGKDYKNIQELKGKKIAVVTDYVWDDWISHNKFDVRLYRVERNLDGLELAALGGVDAMVGDIASVTYLIRKHGFSNLRIVKNEGVDRSLELSFGIRNDWPALQAILEKAVASLTIEEKEAIRAKWLTLEAPGFWRNPVFWYSTLGAVAALLFLLTATVIWNRMLTQRVELRTRELQDANMKLMQAEKMESIGRLAAGVAHEVKNPLAIIQMGADFLSQEIAKDEVTGGVIKDIDDAVHRADTVIRGLLDFSRDKKLELATGSINEVIESSLQLVGHEMRQRQIDVRINLADNLPSLELDTNKLQQVFINLFMNAAHAIEREGMLEVTSRLKTLKNQADLSRDRENRFKAGETVLWIEVKDNGPGIIQQDSSRIFDPFYTTKPVGEGTGLGLSVSRNIINLHHGSIDIQNRREGGASVVIMFQLDRGE
ncbi:MAG: transporter substrate-binding domain-containing protein [Gammaproteobacteria bacterium]